MGGGEVKICDAVLVQYMYSLGSYTCKRIFPVHIIINGKGFLKPVIIYSKRISPVHIITNNLQMANKLLHVLFPCKVSKITQDLK